MLRLRLAALVAVVVLLAACGGSAPSGGARASGAASGQATGAPGATAEPSAEPGATRGTSATEDPVPSDEPAESENPSPTDEPVVSAIPVLSASPTGGGSGAAACSGSAGNREFFEGIARTVDWPVLCGVLPKGWFVSQGSFRQAHGGKLRIGYNGPAEATITLSEGAFCGDDDGCVPPGAEIGEAALGPLEGTLVELDAGGFAIVAARGENPSWLLEMSGLDEATSRAFGSALAVVAR